MSFGLIILCIYMTVKRHVSQQRCVPSLLAQNFLKVSKSTSINLPDEPFISTDRHVHVPSMCYLDATIRVLSSTFNKRPPIKPCGKLPRPYIPWSFRRMRYEELGEIGLGPSAVPICRINVHCKWNRYRRNPLSCWLRITMASDQSYPEKKAEAGREARESLGKLENRTHRGQRVQRGEAKLLELSMYQAESLIAPKALQAKLLPWNVILPCYPRLPFLPLASKTAFSPNPPSHFLENARAVGIRLACFLAPTRLSRCTLYVICFFSRAFLPFPSWQHLRSGCVYTPLRICGISRSWHFVALENIVAIRSGIRNQTFVNRWIALSRLSLCIENVARIAFIYELIDQIEIYSQKYILIKIY